MNAARMFGVAVIALAIALVPFGSASADMIVSYGLGGSVTQAPGPTSSQATGGGPLPNFSTAPATFSLTGQGGSSLTGQGAGLQTGAYSLTSQLGNGGSGTYDPISPNVSVPGPEMGAGVSGLVAACGALLVFALARRRRQQSA